MIYTIYNHIVSLDNTPSVIFAVIVFILLMWNAIALFAGLLTGFDNDRSTFIDFTSRRFSWFLPAFKIGYWLGSKKGS